MDMNSSVNKTFDLTYTIDDLSLDIQEIIDNELKKDTNENGKNAWLCDSCGVLNDSDKKNCECGQERNNSTQDESSSESSFEIINKDGSVQESYSLKTNEPIIKLSDVKIVSWLCPTCGIVTNNNMCSCKATRDITDNSLDKDNAWECAWCNVENQSVYFKCKDCGHLRLDVTKTVNETSRITLPVEKNCWDPRQWSLTNNSINNQQNSSASLFSNEKSETDNKKAEETKWWKIQPSSTCQNDIQIKNQTLIGTHKIKVATSEDTSSIFNETTTVLKTVNVKYKFANKTTADETDNHNKSQILESNKATNDVNSNPVIYNDKQAETSRFLIDYPQVSVNLVMVHHADFITLNMLQEALKTVNNNKSTLDKGVENSDSVCAKLKYKINVCTQTDIDKNNEIKIMTKSQDEEDKKSKFKPFRDCHEPGKWKCAKCKLINPSSVNNCVVCHGGKHAGNKNDSNKKIKEINHRKSLEQTDINDKSTQISNNYPQLDQFVNSITDATKLESVQKEETTKSPKSNTSQKNMPNDIMIGEHESKNNTEALQSGLIDNVSGSEVLQIGVNSFQHIDELIKLSEDFIPTTSLLDNINFDIGCTWTCPSCKLTNSGSTDKCSACKSDCLLLSENFDLIDQFNVFSEQEISEIVDLEKQQIIENTGVQTADITFLISDLNNWRCNVCTFLNSSTLTICRICHNNKTAYTSRSLKYGLSNKIQDNPTGETNNGVINSEEGRIRQTHVGLTLNQKTTSRGVTTQDNIQKTNERKIADCHVNSENKICCTLKKTTLNEKRPDISYCNELPTQNNQQDLNKSTRERASGQNLSKNDGTSRTVEKSTLNQKRTETLSVQNQENIEKDNIWICDACTLQNPLYSKNCSLCNSANPNVIIKFSEEPKNWICETCTLENSSDCIKCIMCETNKIIKENEIFWFCATCTLKNDGINNECTACTHQRFDMKKDSVQRQNSDKIARLEWICPTCTIKNDELHEQCTACGYKRLDIINALLNDNAEPPNIDENKIDALDWICHICTLKNDKNQEQCTACDHNRIDKIIKSVSDNAKSQEAARRENNAEILEWYCPSCLFKNKQDDKQCISCKSSIKEIIKDASPIERMVKIEWRCACKSVNDVQNQKCTACGNDHTEIIRKEIPQTDMNLSQNKDGNVENKWRCKICTFLNSESVSQCRTCKTNKDQERNSQNEAKKSWKCHICTQINSEENNKCSACETEKIVSEENNNSENLSNGWLCSVCTLKNPSDAPMCSACQTSRSVKSPIQNLEPSEDTWSCPACTFVNHNDELECLLCEQFGRFKVIDVPADEVQKKIEKKKKRDNKTYLELIEASNAIIAVNTENFYCIICMTDCQPGDGIILSECLHQFCRECLKATVSKNEEQGVQILCPYVDDTYRCPAVLTERELRHIVDENTYEKHLAAGLREAKATITGDNSDQVYQCRTADCIGWCIYEDGVTNYFCTVCINDNCLNCQAIHEDETCAVYQDRIQTEARTNEESHKTHEALQELLRNREAMNCPRCGIIVAKRSGCDLIVCSYCRTEICWATRGPRWGPKGKGDTSGGCGCRMREGGRLCHPNCGNCH